MTATSSRYRVLVTDAEERSSLAVVRSLGRAGHEVVVSGTTLRPLAGASRHAKEVFRVPDPLASPGEYREAVGTLIGVHSIEVLIPTTDTSIDLLIGLSDELPDLTIPQSGRRSYERLSDKRILARAAGELGVAVPEQIVIEEKGDAEPGDLDRLGYPLVLKPSRSAVVTTTGVIRLGVRWAGSRAEAETALQELPPEAYPLLVQRRIVGDGRGVFVLTWNGRVYAAFGHRRIREKPPTGGVSVYRESVSVSGTILDQARRVLDHFDWNGVAMVEFKEDRETGIPYLMEVNARFWGSLQLAIDAGVDFPRLLVGLATGEEVEPVGDYRTGIRSRWLWGDVDHLLTCLRAGRAARRRHPTLPTPVEGLLRFLVPWRPGDRYEVLRPSDLRPFLRESIQWFTTLGR